MDLTDRWKAMNWQASEFSYANADLLAELKKQSKSDITRLLRSYRRSYWLMLVLTGITPLFGLLKPNEPEYLLCIGLIWAYCLTLTGFLLVKFARFRLPDLSLQTADAIRTSLALVRSINRFEANFVALFAPFVFLGSLLGVLIYKGRTVSELVHNPFALTIMIGSTILITLFSGRLQKFLTNRQCAALIRKLETNLQALEEA
ncbi:hypothetical protein [Spirosoma pulveris]